MAYIALTDNTLSIKYKDYNEYILMGKLPHARWDKKNKLWYIDSYEMFLNEIETYVNMNKSYIENANEILSILKNQKKELNQKLQFKRNKIYVPVDLVSKNYELAELMSIQRMNTDSYYIIQDSIAARIILAGYYNLDIDVEFKPRGEIEVEKYLPNFLFDYQVEGVKFMTERYAKGYNGVLLADAMGLGKTVQALATYYILKQNNPNLKLVVVATKSTMRNAWESDLKRFFDEEAVILTTDDIREGAIVNSNKPVITNYEALSYVLREHKKVDLLDGNYILILDEATKVKNNTSSIYKTISHLRGDSYVIAITGTPLENNLLEFHAIMSIVQPNFMPKYMLNNIFVEYEELKLRSKTVYKVKGYRNLKLFHMLVKPFMLRRTKDLIKMPDKIIKTISVPLTEEQERLIEALREKASRKYREEIAKYATLVLIKRISDHPKLLEMGESNLAEGIKVYDYTAPKLDALKGLVQKSKPPIVIFTEYEDMAQIIYNELSKTIPVAIITGADTGKKRNKIVKEFKEGKYTALIATDALAYGVNLQFAKTLINYDIPWNPAKRAQRIDRIHRVGIKEPRFIYDLVSDGLEKHAYRIITAKLEIFAKAVEGYDSITDSSVMKQLAENYLDIISADI